MGGPPEFQRTERKPRASQRLLSVNSALNDDDESSRIKRLSEGTLLSLNAAKSRMNTRETDSKLHTAERPQSGVSGRRRLPRVAAGSGVSRPGRLALQPLPARWHHGRPQSDRDPALWPPFSRHLSPDPRGLLREGLPLVPMTRSRLDLCGPWARGGSLEKHSQTDTLCPNPRVPRVFAAEGQGARARRLGRPFRDYPWRGRSPNAEVDKLGLFLIVIR